MTVYIDPSVFLGFVGGWVVGILTLMVILVFMEGR
jgi:hypothetical protein